MTILKNKKKSTTMAKNEREIQDSDSETIPENIPKKSAVKRKAEEELNIAEKRFIIERAGKIK